MVTVTFRLFPVVAARPAVLNPRKAFRSPCGVWLNGTVPLFPVSEKKASALVARMNAVGCLEKEIEETLLKGGGVVLMHRPTGVRIRCCQQRSQGLNRFLARRTLVEELE